MIPEAILIAWIETAAIKHGVSPAFATAVAQVESGNKNHRFRVGPIGKGTYYAPFGIHKSYLKKWRIDDPKVNIERGVMALRGKDKRKVLKRYNKSFNEGYYRTICRLEKQYQRR